MANLPQGAKDLKRLATNVGGASGRSLASAVDAALEAGATPDLTMRTRLASTQIGRVLETLGGYSGGAGPVPIRIKKRMRKDAQIRFALAAAKAPLISAPLYFNCRSTETRALLTQVFLDSGFARSLMESSLNAVEFGFQNHEALWLRREDYEVEWDAPGENGGQTTKTEKKAILYVPSTFKDLDPELVTLLWDEKGALFGSLYGPNVMAGNPDEIKKALREKRVNYLPPDKMFLFTPINEYQNYYGEGRLDWAYDHWYWGNLLYLVAMRWYERKADPPLIARAPASAEVVPDPEDTGIDGDLTALTDTDARQDGLSVVARAAGRLRSHGFAAIPSEPYMDENGKPSNVRAWDIEELEIRDMHPAFVDFIDHLDKKKTRAIFVPDTVMSRDRQVGSLGSVEAHVDIAVEVQNQILQKWVRAFNEQVLARFMAYNGIKGHAALVSPGIFRDNRALLKDMILKAWEADMLAEQKLGRLDPNSLTVTFDRKSAARSVGLPILDQDPDAPVKLIPLPETGGDGGEAAKRGTGVGSGPQQSQKGSPAAGKRQAGVDPEPDQGKALALAGSDYEADARSRAERAEQAHTRAAADTRFRGSLSTAEKALAVVLLWMVLRADKKDASGNLVRGSAAGDALVWNGRRLRSNAEIAANRAQMESMVAEYEGRGLALAQQAGSPVLTRTQQAVAGVLGAMSTEIQGPDLDGMMEAAVAYGEAEVADIAAKWDPAREILGLDDDERDSIVTNNAAGLLLNVENIARRNGALLAETVLMGFAAGRQLGLIEDALAFRFNRLYSDLTLEAHLRASYRGAIVAAARKSGLRLFMQTPSEDRALEDSHDLDFWVADDLWWQNEGERRGHPNPHATFGWHHGSTSYWYPVPPAQAIRTPFTD